MRLFTRSRGWSRAHAFACARGCSLVRMFPWVFTCSRVVVGVCGCSLVQVVVCAVMRLFTRSRGWSRAHAFACARGCSRVRMFTLVFECINVFTRVFVFAWVYQVRTGVRVFARVLKCLRAWAMHAPFLRTDGTMDVIMVRPWMPGSQVGLDSGVIMVGPAMDALRVCARAYYPPTTIRCSDLIPATYPVVDPNTMGGIVDYPHLIILLILDNHGQRGALSSPNLASNSPKVILSMSAGSQGASSSLHEVCSSLPLVLRRNSLAGSRKGCRSGTSIIH